MICMILDNIVIDMSSFGATLWARFDINIRHDLLPQLLTFIATRASAFSRLTMFQFDALTVRTVVVVVINVSMRRRVFRRICVICSNFCHCVLL
jgi:hypothetical protein